ncbi:MAG: hypothetical protein ACRCYZ_06930 [Alphaproteobacteria bacterium]
MLLKLLDDLAAVIGELLAPIARRVAVLEQRSAPDIDTPIKAAVDPLVQRLAAVEQREVPDTSAAVEPILARLDAFEKREQPAMPDVDAAVAPLVARLTAIEQREAPEIPDAAAIAATAVAPILVRLDALEQRKSPDPTEAVREATTPILRRLDALEQREDPIPDAVADLVKRINALERIEPPAEPAAVVEAAVAPVLRRVADIEKAVEQRHIPADGRDATQIEILHAIDLDKQHPRGTHARHAGGVIRAFRDTSPIDASLGLEAAGWHVVLNGVASCTTSVDETGRSFRRREVLTDGRVVETAWYTPAMVHRGVWQGAEFGEYEQGDVVTWNGSQWHCNSRKTAAKPGDSADWRLVVKAGRDGRDAAPRDKQIPVIVDHTRTPRKD